MSKKLTLKSLNDKIIIDGDLSLILHNGSYVNNWIKNKYNSFEINKNEITITDSSFREPESLNNFKKNLKKLIRPDIELLLDNNFENKVGVFRKEEENFQEFSEKALEIWSNEYDTKELREYSKTLLKTLKNRKLYKLQLLSSYHLSFSQNACNFSVPGAGKTSIVYATFSYLNSLAKSDNKHVNKLIVVGPPSSFKPWEDEYEECFGLKPKSIRLNSETGINERINSLTGDLVNNYDLYLLTYQSLPNLIEYLITFCKSLNNKVMLVCDEAHKIKSLDGIWSENILRLSPFLKSRVVLTGTPIPNGYQDLVNLFKFIYPNRDVIKLRADYLKKLNNSPYSSEVQYLINNIKPFFIRIKKSDLNLPKITRDLSDNYYTNDFERKIYLKLLEATQNESTDVVKKGLHLRLVQAIYNPALLVSKNLDSHGFFEYSESQYNVREILGDSLFSEIESLGPEYNPSRHYAVLDLVKQLIEGGNKVVIWGYFVDSIKRLDRLLKSNGFNGEIVIGETKKGIKKDIDEISYEDEMSREKIIEEFKKKGGGLDYIITNPIVLGESISLHKVCHHSIYFELSYSAAPYIQSRDRIHRVWLKNGIQKEYNTYYYHFISYPILEGISNIDEEIFNILRRKWKRMLDVIEHDIPLLVENDEDYRLTTINKIINDYRKQKSQ